MMRIIASEVPSWSRTQPPLITLSSNQSQRAKETKNENTKLPITATNEYLYSAIVQLLT
ncbi:hypothetical protein HanRHA438_Chr02g0081321 [Helianthus annuus]|nr:hypothetical protein HanRHA438_Chr02g0081321 [Helianthus annuus]